MKRPFVKAEHITQFIVGAAFCLALINFTVVTLLNSYNRLQPHTVWFEYTKLESTEREYRVNSQLVFMRSYSIWKKDNLKVSWLDSLLCKFPEQQSWEFIGSHPSEGMVSTIDNTGTPVKWRLNVKTPSTPATCKVRSGIDVTLENGIVKRQVIESNEFNFVNANG